MIRLLLTLYTLYHRLSLLSIPFEEKVIYNLKKFGSEEKTVVLAFLQPKQDIGGNSRNHVGKGGIGGLVNICCSSLDGSVMTRLIAEVEEVKGFEESWEEK